MKRHSPTWLAALAACSMFLATVHARQAPQARPAERKTQAEAFFKALASGKPDAFESMAQQQFAPALLARRTPADRQQLADRIKQDFGALTLDGVEASDATTLALTIRGATGLEGVVTLETEPSAPFKIVSMSIRVEAGGPGRNAAPAPAGPPVNGAMTPAELSAALDRHVTALAERGAFSGVVLVARQGVPVFTKAYGLANREQGLANGPDTRFNLGSINKAFTKVAVAQLVAAGKLALGDTIGKLLPDHPNAKAKAATVDQLLTHRAGIPDFFGPAFDAAPKSQFRSNADYYRFVAPQPLLFEPGTKNQYCNGCYIVLGAIIERVSGQKYESYIADHVFGPARMSGAGFFQADRLPAKVATGYTTRTESGDGPLRPNTNMHGMAGSGAGGAYATAGDLLAFHTALREGRLLDSKMTAWFFDESPEPGRPVSADIGIAGGAPGVNAVLESDGAWTVAVVGNLDPPTAEQLGTGIRRQLSK